MPLTGVVENGKAGGGLRAIGIRKMGIGISTTATATGNDSIATES
jgi:hypothetical protein